MSTTAQSSDNSNTGSCEQQTGSKAIADRPSGPALARADEARLERKRIMDAALMRVVGITEDIACAAEPAPQADWTPRRKKVWEDAQKPAKEAPVYLTITAGIAKSIVKADAESQQESRRFGVIVVPSDLTHEEWQRKVQEKQARDARDRAAIDVKPNG